VGNLVPAILAVLFLENAVILAVEIESFYYPNEVYICFVLILSFFVSILQIYEYILIIKVITPELLSIIKLKRSIAGNWLSPIFFA
jgi:hypothetical protein